MEKRNSWASYAVAAAVAVMAWAVVVAGAPHPPQKPLDISKNGVHGIYNLQRKIEGPRGHLLVFNFRAVEPGVLYRGSGFPRNIRKVVKGKARRSAFAFTDRELFDFFRSKNIRHVVVMRENPEHWEEERGYFEYWSKRAGYPMKMTWIPVRVEHAYDVDTSGVQKYPPDERQTGLTAARQVLEIMRRRKPTDGAVYIHCSTGKDRTSVPSAAYELWRNRNSLNRNEVSRDALWQQILHRYRLSNTLIERDPEAIEWSGKRASCGPNEQPGFVCSSWLNKLRPQIEQLVAQVPNAPSAPLPMSKENNGVHGIYNLRSDPSKDGLLLLYNFRAVEPGVLYRGSGFPDNLHYTKADGSKAIKPAAFVDDKVFKLLRAKGVRKIVSLETKDKFYRERGYFDYWAKRTGYKIEVVNMEIKDGAKAYYRGRSGGLRVAGEFIAMMKNHKPQDGAVYLHCSAGKDRTGVVAAAYEMWRNWGHMDRETLWRRVMERYMVSNALIERDPEARRFSGDKASCGDGTKGYVCAKWLEDIRPELERIAQL